MQGMSTLKSITRECIINLKMLNEYIEMTYPEFDQVWLMDKVDTAMNCVRLVENALIEEREERKFRNEVEE